MTNLRPRPKPGTDRDFWIPDNGISREVIIHEINRYLGQDALVRPGRNAQGRSGYLITAFCAPTTEMIHSMKETTSKYLGKKRSAATPVFNRERELWEKPGSRNHDKDSDESMDDAPPLSHRSKIQMIDDSYNTSAGPDGLFRCPFSGTQDCNHRPTKQKCIYDKNLDSHLKPYRCTEKNCEERSFSSNATLFRHQREAHGLHGHSGHFCPWPNCERGQPGNGFPRKWNIADHIKRVHASDMTKDEPGEESSRKRRTPSSSEVPIPDSHQDWFALRDPLIRSRTQPSLPAPVQVRPGQFIGYSSITMGNNTATTTKMQQRDQLPLSAVHLTPSLATRAYSDSGETYQTLLPSSVNLQNRLKSVCCEGPQSGYTIDAFLDTGATDNVISKKLYTILEAMEAAELDDDDGDLSQVGSAVGEEIDVLGSTKVNIRWFDHTGENTRRKIKFKVIPGLYPDMIFKPTTFRELNMLLAADTWPRDDSRLGFLMFNMPWLSSKKKKENKEQHGMKKAANEARATQEREARERDRSENVRGNGANELPRSTGSQR